MLSKGFQHSLKHVFLSVEKTTQNQEFSRQDSRKILKVTIRKPSKFVNSTREIFKSILHCLEWVDHDFQLVTRVNKFNEKCSQSHKRISLCVLSKDNDN